MVRIESVTAEIDPRSLFGDAIRFEKLEIVKPVIVLERDADGIVLLYLGSIQIGLAYWLLTHGIKHVTAFEASTLLLLEPVGNPIFTWIFHGEKPGERALAGGAVILVSTFVKLWFDRRQSLQPHLGEPVA